MNIAETFRRHSLFETRQASVGAKSSPIWASKPSRKRQSFAAFFAISLPQSFPICLTVVASGSIACSKATTSRFGYRSIVPYVRAHSVWSAVR